MQINLENLGAGAAQELFTDEMTRVVANILDPNTEAKTTREITIKMKIKPDPECRECCELETTVSAKLAPVKAIESKLRVGMDLRTGVIDAVEVIARQPTLFEIPVDEKVISGEGNVVPLRNQANQ